ncbi:hypothetical protein [Demequina aurantiaca]|uniref:hypothetical protein n=1 Tax=Demequina aurantiaca TaxID=676200 RepID=UPI003D329E69
MTPIKANPDERLVAFYESAYNYLRKNPGFDGTSQPAEGGLTRRGVDPSAAKPWPGADTVNSLSRDEWVRARLDAVARGDEESPLRS